MRLLAAVKGRFLIYLILDGIGSLLITVALAAYFGEFHLIPEPWRFPHYPIALFLIGAVLTIPFIAVSVKTVLAKLEI